MKEKEGSGRERKCWLVEERQKDYNTNKKKAIEERYMSRKFDRRWLEEQEKMYRICIRIREKEREKPC